MEREVPRIAQSRSVVPTDPLGSRVPRRRVLLASVGSRRGIVSGGSPLSLFVPCMEPPAFTLWLDASGQAMDEFSLETKRGFGVWWRFELDDDVRARLRVTVRD